MVGVSTVALLASATFPLVNGQVFNSYPHDYPGKPSGDFSPAWQNYFEVTEPLPNVTFDIGRNWAGNIPVQRAGHPNNTLFFWAFEKENGSLTAAANERNDEPWGIWLNGGPGSASTLGFLYENGPIHIRPDDSLFHNNYSWEQVADYVWIDQPVGTGWSTADETGFVHDEDEMGTDFMGFLENLVKVFPSLKTRPLHLTGESYAGTYIPYIVKTYFSLAEPPVNLVKFAIGDGTMGSEAVFELLPTTTTIQTYPQLIGYDPAVYEYFVEQEHLCGYDLNLTYPQNGHFPTLQYVYPDDPNRQVYFKDRKALTTKSSLIEEAQLRQTIPRLHSRDLPGPHRRQQGKRDLTGRANGTIDPWYGCFLYDTMVEYALNFTYPWNVTGNVQTLDGFDVYDIPDALNPEVPLDGSSFYNDNRTRAALHAPTSRNWSGGFEYPFLGGQDGADPSVEPMAFLTELASNASAHNISIVFYSGNDDSLVSHRGTEGFTRKPSTPWFDDDGNFAGIAHQERNVTYILIAGAGHLVADQQPARALTFIREFVFGNNETGLVTNSSGTISVEGGENSTLAEDVLPGQLGIYIGSGTTQSTYTFPSATIAAWQSFIATPTAPPNATSAGQATVTTTNATNSATGSIISIPVLICVILSIASQLYL
ncbi:Serine carboxypeptidase-like 21 [Grifola frondosa]|uniref:Carboxypeptidase n=1 Tax=Grifola frondosa TaxID=5627 RepID=A0A1C7MBF2_GRIFR|nr:Serine carboxypeptidase-like 21 [Grifola frondosa]